MFVSVLQYSGGVPKCYFGFKKLYDGHLEVHLRIGPALCQHPPRI
jgi:hypothetical protein